MKVVFVLVLALLVAATAGQRQAYCGRRLAAVIAHLCSERTMANVLKRNMVDYSGQLGYVWPWMDRHSAVSIGRGKRQIITECCENPCTKEELLAYCPDN